MENDPFRKYVGVCAPGQSVKTALLRVYAIILQAAYTYSLQDEYKEVIDPYYSLVGYFNSIRELGGAVRLLQDDIPKRIYRIKNKYGLDKQRYLNHNVEITSRMSSYKIPEKLNQLETTCDSKECLDTAIATNMIAVGMDVDRLGLMVVTGQPKQNSEYIQATSRIGRAFPGLVVTLYNAYRPRDLSHYENFTGYHSQLYRFVEGTTATPFSARARDRVMHALVISAIRLNFPNMANNPDAAAIGSLTKEQLDSVKSLIIDRLNIIKPSARADAEEEIDRFIDWWKLQAAQTKPLRYYVVGTERYNRLMNPYDQPHDETRKRLSVPCVRLKALRICSITRRNDMAFDNNKLGELRPNQIITTFGPGSVVDAVKDSVTILDISYWKQKGQKIIDGRLASYLGVDCFYMPRTSFSGDIPVVTFPYWHVCSNLKCGRLFDARKNFDLDKYLKYGVTCPECHRPAYPSRFITICEDGHMSDFPWNGGFIKATRIAMEH